MLVERSVGLFVEIEVVEGLPAGEQVLCGFDLLVVANSQLPALFGLIKVVFEGLLSLSRLVQLGQSLVFLAPNGKVRCFCEEHVGFVYVV